MNFCVWTEYLEEDLEEQAIEYLSKKDIFNDGSKKDYDMREMTIIEAILKYFNEIDNIVLKLFIYDLVSEKQKGIKGNSRFIIEERD
ncbi:MAG: hypothetical protein ACLTYP_09125 [Eubacterium sp.]|uniref:hypothetical protein n=1 Tax=Eubacterium sp. TaxID=142586 RepID=UPI0039914F1B